MLHATEVGLGVGMREEVEVIDERTSSPISPGLGSATWQSDVAR